MSVDRYCYTCGAPVSIRKYSTTAEYDESGDISRLVTIAEYTCPKCKAYCYTSASSDPHEDTGVTQMRIDDFQESY